MTVYIGNAVGNELGTASGGEPGNQNGKELRIQPWYKNKKGWRVFRPRDPVVAESLVYDMKAACENENIGYSQKNRNTLYKVVEPYGFDCGDANEPCECDCSSLIRVCLAFAGIETDNFNTASEPSVLLDTGEFDEMEGAEYTDSPNKLKAGDILVTRTKGHTALVLNDGSDPEPSDPPEPPDPPAPTEKMVKVIGKSVRVRKKDTTLSKTLYIAHNRAWYKEHGFGKKGDQFPFIDVSPNGWYHIEYLDGDAYISSKERLTQLVEVEA